MCQCMHTAYDILEELGGLLRGFHCVCGGARELVCLDSGLLSMCKCVLVCVTLASDLPCCALCSDAQ
jgi:hypothetical protein